MTGAVKLNTAGGGSVVVQPASSIASDVTVNVPSVNTTLVGTDATQTLTNKTLTTPNIDSAQFATVTGSAPLYGCRAWVNFNGTGTVAIRASGNVSSITDNGTGAYTVNFTTAMPDANYNGVVTPADLTSGFNLVVSCQNLSITKSTSSFPVWTAYGGSNDNKTLYDVATLNVSIFR